MCGFIHAALFQLDWREPSRPQLEEDIDSQDALAVSASTGLLSLRPVGYGSINSLDEQSVDDEDFSVSYGLSPPFRRKQRRATFLFAVFPSREASWHVDVFVLVAALRPSAGLLCSTLAELAPAALVSALLRPLLEAAKSE